MKISELETILAFSSTDKNEEVVVNITYRNGSHRRLEIESFSAFSDGITLNVRTDISPIRKED